MRKNVGSFLAFNELWFFKNQRLLLWLLNAPIIKIWFRWILRIRKDDCSLTTRITEIYPNYFSWGDRLFFDRQNNEWRIERTTDFRTHPKFGKRIYYAFRPLWWVIHFWDWMIADRFIPRWSYGFSTLTAYPDPDPESTTVDGYTGRQSVSETWSTIRSSAGNFFNDSTTTFLYCFRIISDGASSKWATLLRSIFLFDTSSLTSSATISSATLSLYGESKLDNLSITPNVNIYTSNPASNTALANDDTSTVGSTAQCDTAITYSGWSTSGYNDFALNSTGLGNVSKTGVSKFGARNVNYDVANSAPTWSASATSQIRCVPADSTGTSQDPKLVVTYTTSTAYTKTLSETTSLIATIVKQPKKPLSETIALTSSLIKRGSKVFTETVSHTVSIARKTTKVLSETVSNTDSLIRRTARSFVEFITHTDTFTSLKIQFKTLSDSITHSDNLNKSANIVLSETTTLTDTINRYWHRSLSETSNLTDTVLKLAGRTLNEVVTFSDSLIKVPGKIISEAVSLTDSIVKSAYKVISETVTYTDTFTRAFSKVYTEVTTLTDSVTKNTAKVFSETLSFVDSLLRRTAKVITEAITHTDTFTTGLLFGRVLTEAISLTDSLYRIIGKVLSETLSVLAFLSNWFRVNRSSDDTYNSVSRSSNATYNSVTRSSDSDWTGVNREP